MSTVSHPLNVFIVLFERYRVFDDYRVFRDKNCNVLGKFVLRNFAIAYGAVLYVTFFTFGKASLFRDTYSWVVTWRMMLSRACSVFSVLRIMHHSWSIVLDGKHSRPFPVYEKLKTVHFIYNLEDQECWFPRLSMASFATSEHAYIDGSFAPSQRISIETDSLVDRSEVLQPMCIGN